MFYNFKPDFSEVDGMQRAIKPRNNLNLKKTPVNHACEPCRRRKTKCTGDLPCESCRWHRRAEDCFYAEQVRRQTTNQSERTNDLRGDGHQAVFEQLFPGLSPDQLSNLSRSQLIEILTKDSLRNNFQSLSPLPLATEEQTAETDPDAPSLEPFQPMPEDESESSDTQAGTILRGVQDDVNALSLSVKPTALYLGISSVMAILRVIVWLDPDAQTMFKRTPEVSTLPSREITSPPTPMETEDARSLTVDATSAWDDVPHINAYFTFFHPEIPLLDEQYFRDTYINRRRSDARWLLLLNVVLALGCAVGGTTEDSSHRRYYNQLRRYLTLETFGSAHIETVQALGLLSGYYLHYLQLPNQANSLMGTTIRLAVALGLHRDFPEGLASSRKGKTVSSIELRRRVWWCIFCLDAWACGPLGRPSMGRLSHAVTARYPQQPIGSSPQTLTLLQDNIRYATISTRAEDALAISPILKEAERTVLDDAYSEWFKTSSIHNMTPTTNAPNETSGITVLKNIMRWRYLWSRIQLHRPLLLWYAMRRIPFESLTSERQDAIVLCRNLTGELIYDISSNWAGRSKTIMSGWHAAWLLYQSTMVPLLSLFIDSVDQTVIEMSHAQVQTAIQALADQIGYAHTAKRSCEVVSLIYEASQRFRSGKDSGASMNGSLITSEALTRGGMPGVLTTGILNSQSAQQYAFSMNLDTPQQEEMMDNMFDSLNWSVQWPETIDEVANLAGVDVSLNIAATGGFHDPGSAQIPWFGPVYNSGVLGFTPRSLAHSCFHKKFAERCTPEIIRIEDFTQIRSDLMYGVVAQFRYR